MNMSNSAKKMSAIRVGIVLFQHCSLWSATGSREILQRANKARDYFFPESQGRSFDVEYILPDHVTSLGIPSSEPVRSIYEHIHWDWIIVPGFDHPPKSVLDENRAVIPWIIAQHAQGVKVASICTGSFFLAASGILNNKTATTHWLVADTFKQIFPEVTFLKEKILIDHENILISGGATSFHNLMIHLVELYMGRKVAIGVSKLYLIDLHKDSQESYAVFTGHKTHKDAKISEIQHYIESNYTEKLNLDHLTEKACMSKRNFIRRFKNATRITPYAYIQKIRVEAAKEMLETALGSIEEVVYKAGYEDVDAFRQVFIKHTGITPGAYRKKYNPAFYMVPHLQ